MNIDDFERIAKVIKEFDLAEVQLEGQDFKLHIKQNQATAALEQMQNPALMSPANVMAMPLNTPSMLPANHDERLEDNCHLITSPMVGTFYRCPSPDRPPFVEVGKSVQPTTIVCIIEAMKVMNEIPADASGTILEVLVKDGQPIEFGQPLFKIRCH